MNPDELEQILSKLRVKSGLIGDRRSIDRDWAIGFWYDRDAKKFAATLYYKHRQTTMGLRPEFVETRGRSQWFTDNTYRLTPAGIAEVKSQILRIYSMRPPA